LAALQAQAPAQIAQTYGQASERQAAFGKGYSDGLQHLQNQTNNESNALIAQNGGNALGRSRYGCR
jgi:hypothetical protein